MFSATKNLEDDDLKSRGKKIDGDGEDAAEASRLLIFKKKNARRFSSNWKCCDLMVPFQDLQWFEIQLEIINLGVSENNGTPNYPFQWGFFHYFHHGYGTPIFGNTQICIHFCVKKLDLSTRMRIP